MKKKEKRPRLSDFRYYQCSIDQNSDKVIFLYKENFIATIVELIVTKNRYENTEIIELIFNKETGFII